MEVNLDLFEKEIGNAEQYLAKSTSLSGAILDGAKGSQGETISSDIKLQFVDKSAEKTPRINPTNDHHQQISPSNKYVDPLEREKLIKRLLQDYSARKKSPSTLEGVSSDYSPDSIENENEEDADRSNDNSGILFYASDISNNFGQNYAGSFVDPFPYSSIEQPDLEHFKQEYPSIPSMSFTQSHHSNSSVVDAASEYYNNNMDKDEGIEMVDYYSDPEISQLQSEKVNYFNASRDKSDSIKPRTDETVHSDDSLYDTVAWPSANDRRENKSSFNANASDNINIQKKKSQSRPASAPLARKEPGSQSNSRLGHSSQPTASAPIPPPRKILKSREEYVQEAEQQIMNENEFRPRLMTGKARSKSGVSTTQSMSQFGADRVQELWKLHENQLKRREKLKREEEKLELLECTFRPQLSRKAQRDLDRQRKEVLKKFQKSQKSGNESDQTDEYPSSKNRSMHHRDGSLEHRRSSRMVNTNTRYPERYEGDSDHDRETTLIERERERERDTNHHQQQQRQHRNNPNSEFRSSQSNARVGNDNSDNDHDEDDDNRDNDDHDEQKRISKKVVEMEGMEASRRLHEDANTRMLQQEWLRKHVEDLRSQEFPFQPSVNPSNRHKVAPVDQKPIHERIFDIQKEQQRRLHLLKSRIEEEQHENWTFQPKIDRESRVLAWERHRRDIKRDGDLWDRLEVLGDDEDEEDIYIADDDKHRQFSHDTNKASSSSSSSSSSASASISHGNNLKNNTVHRSELSSWGNHLEKVGKLQKFSTFVNRMKKEGEKIVHKKQKLVEKYEAEQASTLKTAAMCPKSRQILAVTKKDASNFDDRQRDYLNALKKKQDYRRYLLEEQGKQWFQPKILETSDRMVMQAHPERKTETETTKITRWTQQALEKSKQTRKTLEDSIYGPLTFQPTIDAHSQSLVERGSGLQELVENTRGKHIRENVRKRIEEERSIDCSFQPQITGFFKSSTQQQHRYEGDPDQCPVESWHDWNVWQQQHPDQKDAWCFYHKVSEKSLINMKHPEKMVEDIQAYRREKEEKRKQKLMEKEMKELEDCTFHPQISPDSSYWSNLLREDPVIVRGLGRHLELKELSTQLRQKAKDREAEVFRVKNVEKYRRQDDHSTILEVGCFRK